MTVERKVTAGGTLKAVSEGRALVRLATFFKVDSDGDVLEHHLPPTAPPLVASIQPYYRHDVHSLGHAAVREDAAKGEMLADFEFNDTDMAQQVWKALAWDASHEPSIQEFSWAFRVRERAARHGTHDGKSVRFLGPAADGGPGVWLIEAGPVLKGASVNSGTISVRGQRLSATDLRDHTRMLALNIKVLKQIMARCGSSQRIILWSDDSLPSSKGAHDELQR